MKIRVKWHMGRKAWWCDYANDQAADARIQELLTIGFMTQSKAGVRTYYPSHRISRITRRTINR